MSLSRSDIDWKAAPSLFLGPTGTVSPQFVPTLTAAGPVGLTLISFSDCVCVPADALSPLSSLLPQAVTVSAVAATRPTSAGQLLSRRNIDLSITCSPPLMVALPRPLDAIAKSALAAVDGHSHEDDSAVDDELHGFAGAVPDEHGDQHGDEQR